MNRPNPPRLAVTLLVALLSAPLAAQTPAAGGATKSLGGGAGTGKVLSYDELKACLTQQEALNRRRAEVEAAKPQLDADKAALVADQESLKADRAKVDEAQQAVRELNERYKDYSARVSAWNERSKTVADRTGMAANREREALDRERTELEKLQPALEADRVRLGDAPQKAVDAYNAKATALDARVADWNQRNAKLAQEAEAVNTDRQIWTTECADRRYREDDEKDILRNK